MTVNFDLARLSERNLRLFEALADEFEKRNLRFWRAVRCAVRGESLRRASIPDKPAQRFELPMQTRHWLGVTRGDLGRFVQQLYEELAPGAELRPGSLLDRALAAGAKREELNQVFEILKAIIAALDAELACQFERDFGQPKKVDYRLSRLSIPLLNVLLGEAERSHVNAPKLWTILESTLREERKRRRAAPRERAHLDPVVPLAFAPQHFTLEECDAAAREVNRLREAALGVALDPAAARSTDPAPAGKKLFDARADAHEGFKLCEAILDALGEVRKELALAPQGVN